MGIFRRDKSEDLPPQEPAQLLPIPKPSAADPNPGPTASIGGSPPVSKLPHPQTVLVAPVPHPILPVPIQPPSQQPPHQKISTAFLDKGTKIKGNLQFDCPVQIDGQIEGEVVGNEHITIGENANVVAAIRATSVIIDGRVNGDVTATDRIELRPHARVLGNLTAPKIVIQEGAQYEGRCAMKTQPAQAESSKSSHLMVIPAKGAEKLA